MKFYTFEQNNSGGVLEGPRAVVIEAQSAEDANFVATFWGVYFDGVLAGSDCPCCGDRWRTVSEYDANDKPSFLGYDLFSDEVNEIPASFWEDEPVLVVYANGETREVTNPHPHVVPWA